MEEGATALVFIFALALFFAISYVVGRVYNRARLRRLRKILHPVLLDLDRKYQARVLGTKVIIASGERLGTSIARYSLTILLLGRESIINWLIARVAGRTDIAILRADLPVRLPHEFDVFRRGSPPHRHWLRLRKRGPATDHGDFTMRVVRGGPPGEAAARRVIPALSRLKEIWSYSLRQQTPALVVNFGVDGLTSERFTDIMKGLQAAARAVAA